jgi:phosphoribosylaminoimidazole carboxylase (NCAIR synthetase)
VLKTAVSGYDGKGQIKLNHADEAAEAWQKLGEVACILEGWIEFEREISMVAARDVNGRIAHYNLIENSHANHILDVSVAPANLPSQVLAQAEAMVETVLTELDVIGVSCVEFFLYHDVVEAVRVGTLPVGVEPVPRVAGKDQAVRQRVFGTLRAAAGLRLRPRKKPWH